MTKLNTVTTRRNLRLPRNAARLAVMLGLALAAAGCSEKESDRPDAGLSPALDSGAKANFFVTSDKSKTGNLGGPSGADARCQRLAAAVKLGAKTWVAYLSVERDATNGNMPTHARDRIGKGPWYNSKGDPLASNLEELHALDGAADLFLDELGNKVPGQWPGSPTPVEHDILTGSSGEGMLMPGKTCADWTSEAADAVAQVGHSDGLGPMMNPAPPYSSWNSSHESGGCHDTALRGGAGRLYCFGIE